MANKSLWSSFLSVAYRTTLVVYSLLGTACDPRTFDDGFEDAELQPDIWQLDAHPACLIETSADKVREGNLALRIEAPEGLRCELIPRVYPPLQTKFRREPFGHERWYKFSVFVDDLGTSREPSGLGDNTIVAQWHSSPDPFFRKERGRGPPLALRIFDGTWGITYGWDTKLHSDTKYLASNWHWVGPVKIGRWIDWSFRVVWSYEDDGVTEVWKDSELVMERTGPNLFNDFRGVYLKLGLYHPRSDQTIFLDRVSITN